MTGFLICTAIIVIGIAMVAVQFKKIQQRIAAIKDIAARLGFTYDLSVVRLYDVQSSGFKLFNCGNTRYCKNVIEQKGDNLSISHFDYYYTTGTSKNRTTHVQTVTLFVSDTLRLPAFVMEPETFFHKLGDFVGMKDIDFNESPEFSKKYLLKGSDEPSIRSFFDTTLLQFLSEKPGYSIEAADATFIIYNRGWEVPAEQIDAVLRDRIEIFKMIDKRSRVEM